MVLFLICNPQLGFPYQEDMKKSQNKIAGIESLLKECKRPTFGKNYIQLVKTGEWWHLYQVHEACTCFEPEQRPSAADIITLLLEREEEFGKLHCGSFRSEPAEPICSQHSCECTWPWPQNYFKVNESCWEKYCGKCRWGRENLWW